MGRLVGQGQGRFATLEELRVGRAGTRTYKSYNFAVRIPFDYPFFLSKRNSYSTLKGPRSRA